MNRQEFIEKLVITYEDFTEKNIKARQEAYNIALDETLNFEKIFEYILKEYDSFKFAPTPAYILKIIIPKIKADELSEKPYCNEEGEIDISVYNPAM